MMTDEQLREIPPMTNERLEEIRARNYGHQSIQPIDVDDLINEIDRLRKGEVREEVTGKTSDGYHTFDELYEHRITLWIALCRTQAAVIREAWNPVILLLEQPQPEDAKDKFCRLLKELAADYLHLAGEVKRLESDLEQYAGWSPHQFLNLRDQFFATNKKNVERISSLEADLDKLAIASERDLEIERRATAVATQYAANLEVALAMAREDSERLQYCFGDPENGASRWQIESLLMNCDTLGAARIEIDSMRALAALDGK